MRSEAKARKRKEKHKREEEKAEEKKRKKAKTKPKHSIGFLEFAQQKGIPLKYVFLLCSCFVVVLG